MCIDYLTKLYFIQVKIPCGIVCRTSSLLVTSAFSSSISTGSWSRFCITVLHIELVVSQLPCCWQVEYPYALCLVIFGPAYAHMKIASLLYIELLASRVPTRMVSGDFSTCIQNPVRFIAWVKYWSWGESSSFFMCDPKTFTFTSPFWRSRVVSEYAVLKNLHQWFMHTKKDWGCLDS